MGKRKPTIKELEAKIESLTRINNICCEMIDAIGNTLKQYVEFKDDVKDFQEYQKEILDARKKIKNK